MVRPVMGTIQHRVNVLSIYCRLVDAGISKKTAKRLAATLTYLPTYFLYKKRTNN
jgi:hypothetical protein